MAKQNEPETGSEYLEETLNRMLAGDEHLASRQPTMRFREPVAIHLHLPEMTVGELKELIREVVKEVREDEYRQSRRAAGYGGLRSGVGKTHPY